MRTEVTQIKFRYAAALACALLLCLAFPCRADATYDAWLRGLLGTSGAGKDSVLEAQLKAAGFKYIESDDHDFLLLFETMKNGQRKFVFVDSHLKQLMFEKIRVMWIKINSANKRVTGEQAFNLLRRNAGYKIGAWQVTCNSSESECYPVFQIEIPGDASTSYLKMAINTISLAADDVADDWTPKGWMDMKSEL
jgi:hypothetical protein